MFKDELIEEYTKYKKTNNGDFSWWNYVNIKSDIKTALALAKFFYPDILEVDGCFLLKDKFSEEIYQLWKQECQNDKTCIEKMMNIYQIRDFFHINVEEDGNIEEQIEVLGEILKKFWTLSFKDRFSDRKIVVDLFKEEDGEIFITVYENM